MFCGYKLRSKRKLDSSSDDECEIKRVRKESQSFLLETLPIEVIESVIKHLKVNDIKSIRLANKFLKHIIDNYKYIWQEKFSIKCTIRKKQDIICLNEFLKKFNYVSCVKIDCNERIDTNDIYLLLDLFEDSNFSTKIDLVLNNFNLNMFPILMLFLDTCKSIKFNNLSSDMIREIMNNTNGSICFEAPHMHLINLESISLNMNANLVDGLDLCPHETYHFETIHTGLLFTLMHILRLPSSNVKHIYLKNSVKSLQILRHSFHSLDLDSLIIDDEVYDEDFDMDLDFSNENSNKPSVKLLSLKCSLGILKYILRHMVDIESINELILQPSDNVKDDIGDDFYYDSLTYENIFNEMNNKLKNLKKFTLVNYSLDYFSKNNFKFSKNLKEVHFMVPVEIDRLTSFIKDYLYQFKSIETMRFMLKIECQNNSEEYRRDLFDKLKILIEFLNDNYPQFNEIRFKIVDISKVSLESKQNSIFIKCVKSLESMVSSLTNFFNTYFH